MREKEIESYLRDRIRRIGGKAYKFVSPGNNGVPDRLVCLTDWCACPAVKQYS